MDAVTRDAIAGATVEAVSESDPKQKKQTTTNAQGNFVLSLPYGAYDLSITHMGYRTAAEKVTLASGRHNLAETFLSQAVQELDELSVEVRAIRTSQKGDTVVYNADAFKVTKDADAETLLSKMPGITITDGTVEAQGETVKKVFVDGKEFFGEDVAATIKNLPAEVIEKIETYNRLSDQAQLSGVDDGEGYKAINIVTKPSMRTGVFGKVFAGYGHQAKYLTGGNVNMFTGKHRLSLIGLANNINQQNFSIDDILGATGSSSGGGRGGNRGGRGGGGGTGNFMVPSQPGISKVGSAGVNYSSQWNEKVDLSASYFFNRTSNRQQTISERENFPVGQEIRYDSSSSWSRSQNYNHRFNGKLDWKIDDRNSVSIRPNFSYQDNDGLSGGTTLQRNLYPNAPIGILSDLVRSGNSDSHGYNASLALIWSHKFAKPGRTVTVDGYGSYSLNDRESESFNYTTYPGQSRPDRDRKERNISDSYSYSISGNVVYTEPLTTKAQIVMQYRGRYSYSDADRRLYDLAQSLTDPTFDPDRSNVYNSGYSTHRLGPGIRYGGTKTTLIGSVYYQLSSLSKNQDFPMSAASSASASFNDFVYFGMMNHSFNSQNTLRMYVRSSTSNPSLTQLQNYVDRSNPMNVTEGNPGLKPTYGHSISANYNRSSIKKGQSFQAMLNFAVTQNDIVDYTIYSDGNGTVPGLSDPIDPYGRYTKPVNVSSGSWSLRGGVNFGTPIDLVKSNINFNLSGGLSQSPSYIDTQKNLSKAQNLRAGTSLGSNISANLDFTLSYSYGFNNVENTIASVGQSRNSNNKYWNQNASARVKWIFWKGFTFTGNTSYYTYKGITDNFKEEYCIVNLFVGKKIFKNQRGEINIGVNDLLDQSKSFSVNTTPQYIQRTTTNVISRYYSVQFIYNIRTFKGRAPQETDNQETLRDIRPGGHPGGGHPGGRPGGF